MIREDRLAPHRSQFAVLPSSLVTDETEGQGGLWLRGSLQACWFRRKAGVTRASTGLLSGLFLNAAPVSDAASLLALRPRWGSWTAHCASRWDGGKFWTCEQDPAVAARHLEELRAMLAGCPAIPPGYDGWWRDDHR